MNPHRQLARLAVLGGIALAAAATAFAQANLPDDFVDLPVVGGLHEPANLCFLPDGRLLVIEQRTAHVRLVVEGAFATTDPVLAVPNVRSAGGEQGLLGVAADPGWPARPYVYVYYDYALSAHLRISRFTASGDLAFTGDGELVFDPGSRYDVLTTLPDNADNHNGGSLRFGVDGALYAAVGDDAVGCNAQRRDVLAGKILRLDVSGLPDGAGGPPFLAQIAAAGNPFAASPDSNARLVWAYGLRNPFSFHVDPLTGELFVADVGEAAFEELNRVTRGGLNFGWPYFEGPWRRTPACAGADTTQGFTAPIYWYARAGGTAIIGGTVYRRPPNATSPFPAEYEGAVFVSDVYRWFMRCLKRDGEVWSVAPAPGQPNATDWAQLLRWSADYEVGPDGALWYTMLWTNFLQPDGQIRRIVSTNPVSVAPAERGPTIALAPPWPSPARGAARLAYQLDRERRVWLTVHDVGGRCVRTLVRGALRAAGSHAERWDGRADDGGELPAGIYVVRLTTGAAACARRLVWIR